jgi:hypothetical protein
MRNLRLKDVMRAENQESAMPGALASLCHKIGGRARFCRDAAMLDRVKIKKARFPRASSV